MIRKFFAVQILILFVLMQGSFFVVYAFTHTYLNEKKVVEEILPSTYGPVLVAVSESVNLSDTLRARIAQAVSPQTYEDIMRIVLSEFFKLKKNTNPTASIDLTSLKNRLAAENPPDEEVKAMYTSINAEIPPHLQLMHADLLGRALRFIEIGLLPAILLTSVLSLISVSFSASSDWQGRVLWVGASIVSLAVFLSLCSFVIEQFPLSADDWWGVPSQYLPLSEVLMSAPRMLLAVITSIVAGVGFVTLLLGHFVAFPKKNVA